jgi:dienelactone hydrolase
MGFLAVGLCAFAWCQQSYQVKPEDVLQAPPPYTFDDWKLVEEAEFSRVYEISFASAFTSGVAENDKVRVRCWMPHPPKTPVPSVILLHYWGAADNQMEISLAKRLNDRGIAAFIVPLPYHLSRTAAGRRSGQDAIRPNAQAMVDTMRQATLDIRRTLDFISSRSEFNPSMIGLSGTSLGSIVGSLAFATDQRIKSAAFTLGGIDLAHILMKSSIVQPQREILRKNGVTEESLREALAPVEPLNYLKANEPGRATMVIMARYDQVIPTSSTEKLIDALGTTTRVELNTGHYGGFVIQNRILRLLAGYFDASLQDKPYTVPNSLDVPTIRVGLAYNPESGAQVALGIDLWRSGKEWYAGPLITPKGIQGFAGRSLNRQMAVGVMVTGTKTTWGLFWNMIL